MKEQGLIRELNSPWSSPEEKWQDTTMYRLQESKQCN